MESSTGEFKRLFQKFIDFVVAIRNHPWLKNAWILYIGERNTGQVSASHGHVIDTLAKADFVRDNCKPDAGVWTTKERKIQYLNCAQNELSRRAMKFMSDMIVITGRNESEEERRIDLKKEFINQLRRIQPTRSIKNTELIPTFQTWSGKLGADGKPDPAVNDDIAFAFFLALFWMMEFIKKRIDGMNFTKFGKLPTQELLNYRKDTALFTMPQTVTRSVY